VTFPSEPNAPGEHPQQPFETSHLDLGLATFVCVSTVQTLAHGAVSHQPELLTDDRVETFIDEVTRLVIQYLI